jgi:hypothetical protein
LHFMSASRISPPLAPFIWMSILALISLCVNPLLPFIAYALQLWASTWNWRDRWASVRAMATPGIVFVCCLVVLALLDQAHVWIVPPTISNVQSAWQAHLLGDLSLSPLDLHSLVARLILLLPLAPGLALLYEVIAPRTQTQPRRILLLDDLVPPIAALPTAADQAPEPTPEPIAPEPAPLTPKKQPSRRKRSGTQPDAQMTIDSFLAPETAAATTQKSTETKAMKQPPQHSTPQPETPIDWDNVLE